MKKHAPGPWIFDEVRTDCGRAFRIGSGEMLKAGKGCCIIYDDYPGNPENERKANARLIAAAPELLEELKFLRKRFHAALVATGTDPEFADIAVSATDATIAKAEGRNDT